MLRALMYEYLNKLYRRLEQNNGLYPSDIVAYDTIKTIIEELESILKASDEDEKMARLQEIFGRSS